jgi:hypothetical protein
MPQSWLCSSLIWIVSLLAMPATAHSGCQCMVGVQTDAGPFGSRIDVAEFSAAVQALPPAAFLSSPVQSLPSSAYVTNLPAVSQQGTAVNPSSPGTCEAQSFGYGLGSYTAPRQPDGSPKWNPTLAQNSVSPAYLFAVALIRDDDASCPKGERR